ncbi:Uncharacterized protein ALO42_02424 [Pseudomonas syringae pv. atrofaciens]|uniref:DUF7281 domain-containing protein n=1 Tax=Pseudomonas syringae pv. atrofaciens TaxID=192087 RepID=A0AAD0MXM7_PSESX|nr:hypothetical protein [Pseudomonas syringae]AVX22941.1 hypothetical protein DA456_05820 [Pseudomonas syringae pv. atrofaciens]AZG86612.1 hypothetical protein N032_13710 [Pseudomonas syringae pv. pisi str. PP1]KPW06438.1 Uncharacterized protein ALO42_02424 [Pseudomonas syringae pv. atrofaciens]RMM24081.1 hypothetical protein ALQ81_03223 [Pseudomonas syringae pv. pisi]UZS65050.1 hypothetical protein OQB64_13250 [Pseudomonas syringae]
MRIFDNIRAIKPVVIAIRQDARKVKINATWLSLNTTYSIGKRLGATYLTLTNTELHTVRMMLQRETGIDALLVSMEELEGDRLALAKKSRNEKLARLRPGDFVVMVASLSGQIKLATGVYSHPARGTLNVPAEELHGLDTVILVENQAVMFAVNEYHWPSNVLHLPMLFRGSPQITPAAVTRALSGVKNVICFPDFDPQGWMNTLTARAQGIVVPSANTIVEIIVSERDKPQDYAKQDVARAWLQRVPLPMVQDMLSRKLALSQESMAGMELEYLSLNPTGSNDDINGG